MAKKNRSTKVSGPTTEQEAAALIEEAAAKTAEINAEYRAQTAKANEVSPCPHCGNPISKAFTGNDGTTICAICKTKEIGPGKVTAPIPQRAPVPERKPIVIDATAPWARWADPDVLTTNLHNLSVSPEGESDLALLGESGDRLGKANHGALRQLGWHAQYPVEFIEKLSPATRAVVVNERIQAARDSSLSVIFEDGEFANIVPGRRGIAPYKEVAQITLNTMREVYGNNVELVVADHNPGRMHLRLLTDVQETITERRRGDVLQMGIELNQDYGIGINLALYINRLICTNGMTAERREFEWRSPATISVEHQLAWLTTGIGEVIDSFRTIVDKSKQMAERELDGDPRQILEGYARAMRFPRRRIGQLIEAFELENDLTQWGILNAFTRVTTHTMSGDTQRAFQDAAGVWVRDFDMVHARLPLSVARSLGAELLTDA